MYTFTARGRGAELLERGFICYLLKLIKLMHFWDMSAIMFFSKKNDVSDLYKR